MGQKKKKKQYEEEEEKDEFKFKFERDEEETEELYLDEDPWDLLEAEDLLYGEEDDIGLYLDAGLVQQEYQGQ